MGKETCRFCTFIVCPKILWNRIYWICLLSLDCDEAPRGRWRDDQNFGGSFATLPLSEVPKRRLSDNIRSHLFKVSNVVITCSSSGKLTTSLVEYWRDHVILPSLKKHQKFLLISDCWGGQTFGKGLYESSSRNTNERGMSHRYFECLTFIFCTNIEGHYSNITSRGFLFPMYFDQNISVFQM